MCSFTEYGAPTLPLPLRGKFVGGLGQTRVLLVLVSDDRCKSFEQATLKLPEAARRTMFTAILGILHTLPTAGLLG